MKIEITLNTPELASAINNLADALRYHQNVIPFENTIAGSIQETAERTPTAPAKATTTAPVEQLTGEAQTPAQTAKERKEQLAEEIRALGYEPPASGTVAKFEEALQACKDAIALGEQGGSDLDIEPQEKETPEIEEEEETTSTKEITHDTVRAFAGDMVKANPEMGRTKLGAILKKVNAASITAATQKQLEEMVPLFEKAAGKTFGE